MPPVRVLVALLAAVSLHCAAAPFALPVGDVRLGFDLPGGFADAMPTGSPRVQDIAESLTPASNRILVFGLTDGDMRRFNSGDAPELKQYLLVVTPRSLEQERMSAAQFDKYVREGLRGAAPLPGDGDFQKTLDAKAEGESVLLAELRRDAESVALLRGVRLPPADGGGFSFFKRSQYVLTTVSVVLLRGKAIHLTVTGGYENKADVEWISSVTLRWIDELRRLNVSR